MRVLFMGTPDFAIPSLKALASDKAFKPVAVFTQPDRPAGRGMKLKKPPVKELAEKLGIPLYQPENINSAEAFKILSDYAPDVICVVAYAQFLTQKILDCSQYGCVNVHSSLLPQLRGAAPIQWAIVRGFRETGVTTMKLVKKMDAGPIYLQKKTLIENKDTGQTLHDRLAEMGGVILLETLKGLEKGTLTPKEQNESEATYASILKKENGLIHWSSTSLEIFNLVRGFTPWPGTYTYFEKKRLKVHKLEMTSELFLEFNKYVPGRLLQKEGSLFVKTGDGWLRLLELQLEGKTKVLAEQFLRIIEIDAGPILKEMSG